MINVSDAKNWIEKHPKATAAIAAVLMFLIGYGAGLMKSPRVVEKEKIVTKVQDHIVYKDREVTQKKSDQDRKKRVHTEIVETKTPDGAVVTKITKDESDDTDTKTDTNKTVDKDKTTDHVVYQTVEKYKLTEKPLNWRAGVGLGFSIPHAFGQPEIGLPGLQGFVIQLDADRRIAGPVWIGAFLTTQLTAGLHFSAEW